METSCGAYAVMEIPRCVLSFIRAMPVQKMRNLSRAKALDTPVGGLLCELRFLLWLGEGNYRYAGIYGGSEQLAPWLICSCCGGMQKIQINPLNGYPIEKKLPPETPVTYTRTTTLWLMRLQTK